LENAILARCIEEYKELARIAGVIDDKAQKAGVAAGAFLAAGLGLLTSQAAQTGLTQKVGPLAFVILFIIIGLLIAVSALSLFVSWVKMVALPSAEGLVKMTTDLTQVPDNEWNDGMSISFLRAQADLWIDSLLLLRGNVHKKSRRLWWAQTVLAVAVLFIGILVALVAHKLSKPYFGG
jgi:hypothetical protein